MRVASLLPSATELCYAVGVEPVGVSHSCDHPPAARGQPTLTRSRIDTAGTASDIDSEVQEIDGSAYELLTDRLARLSPDVILTQGTCEVCAVDATAVHEAVATLGLDAEVVTLDPHSLDDVMDDVRRVGAATDREQRAERVASRLEGRIDRATWDDRPPQADRPRTLVFDWTEPPMLAGHWIPEMVRQTGGRMSRPVAQQPAPSVPVEWSWVREYDPERVIIAPCGFDTDRAVEAVEDLRALDGWKQLTAVQTDGVYVADGSGLFNRPGPRLVDTLEALRHALDPNRRVTGADGIRRLSDRPTPAD